MGRIDGRAADELRPWKIELDYLSHPAGSALITCGGTRLICAASCEDRLPPWMKSQGKPGGWVTAEYSMLPAATGERTRREVSSGKPGGRTMEIQRLIGRALRTAVDLPKLGEYTFTVDCDAIDADGGTRCAGITGGATALSLALRRGFASGTWVEYPWRELVAAVSVGIVDGVPMLDLCYEEDSRADVDMNVVMTESGKFVEIQGTAEEAPFSRSELNGLIELAESGLRRIFEIQRSALTEARL